jgi:hypothetical protein
MSVFHAEGSGHANQDRWLVHPLTSGAVRVGAIDGVTPWRCEPVPSGDAGAFAASVAVSALLLDWPLPDALQYINETLHSPSISPSQRQVMTSAAVADCRRDGTTVSFYAAVAADCEVWVADSLDGPMSLAVGGDFLRADVRAAIMAKRVMHPDWTHDERVADEAHILENPATQVRHALGRYARPVLDQASGNAPVVILATDGAHLKDASLAGIPARGLQQWCESAAGAEHPRDDLTRIVICDA